MEVKGAIAHLLAARAAGGKVALPREGSRVTATVERYLGKGRWLLRLNGATVEARSHLSLVPGQRIIASVIRRGGSVLLVASKAEASQLGGASSAELAGQSRTLASLLLAAGSPARPALMERLASALRRRSGRAGGARLDAEAVTRGFRELPEEMEALVPGVGGEEASGGFPGRSGDDPEERREARRESAGEQLARAAVRKSPRGDHPIQLYNHRALLGSGWVALPLGFTASEPRGGPESHFSGLLHLYLPEPSRWTLNLESGGFLYRIVCEKETVEIGVEETGSRSQGRGADEDDARDPGGRTGISAREAALRDLLVQAGYDVRISDLPFDGMEFLDHSNLQDGVDLLQ